MTSGPWRGRPMKGLVWPKEGPAQEKIIRHRCTFRYEDGQQCIYQGEEVREEGGMCSAHRIIESRREAHRKSEQRRQRRRTRPKNPKVKKEVLVKKREEKLPPVPGPPTDPTAPYCTCKNRTADKKKCVTCGKMHFIDWVEKKRNGKR